MSNNEEVIAREVARAMAYLTLRRIGSEDFAVAAMRQKHRVSPLGILGLDSIRLLSELEAWLHQAAYCHVSTRHYARIVVHIMRGLWKDGWHWPVCDLGTKTATVIMQENYPHVWQENAEAKPAKKRRASRPRSVESPLRQGASRSSGNPR